MMNGIRNDMKTYITNMKSGDSDTWFMTAITILNICIVYYMFTSSC